MTETRSSIELNASTGDPQVDSILRGLIGIYQTVFPERLRCVYVVGSYSDGSAVPGSDLDLGVVFDEPLTDEQLLKFRQINQAAALLSPVRLDCGTVSPARFTNGIPAGLKSALFVYGENVFAGLLLEPIETALRRAMSNTFHSLYVLRQRDKNLVYPLKYPDPAGEFYGYERWGTFLGNRTFAPGVRSLVTSVTLITSCCVMIHAGQYVASKQESVLAYRDYVSDEWTEFVQEVYQDCKQTWHYQLPETAQDPHLFRGLCETMLVFENQFLICCRKLVLKDLRRSERSIQSMALYRLGRIAYPDEEFEEALLTLQGGEDTELSQLASTILEKLQSV